MEENNERNVEEDNDYNIDYTRTKIKALMEKAQVTQTKLANSINVSQPTVSKWLSPTGNDIPVEGLVSIAKYFQVSIDDLIYDSDFEGKKVDVSFSGIVKFVGEFAKEYGIDIECIDDYYEGISTRSSTIKFSYTLCYKELRENCERQELAYKYIADFLKDFSSIAKIQNIPKSTYDEIIDIWIDKKLTDANEKYDEYEDYWPFR